MAVKICAFGDIMLDEQPLCNNIGVKEVIRQRGSDFLFEEIMDNFKDADIVLGNLECSIKKKNSQSPRESAFFCADEEAVKGLTNAGINVLSVANNHTMENGMHFFQGTVELLRENQIIPIGIANSTDILEINGRRIGLLAYSFIDDGIPKSGYNKIPLEKQIIEDIGKIKPESDLIVVCIHWGKEYIPYPSPEQVQIGRSLIDAGADIILGGHPHVTQGYEYYKNGLIIYSLGNFIFDQTFIPSTRESFIVEIIVHNSPPSIDVTFVPILINKHEYRPQFAGATQGRSMIDAIETTRETIEGQSITDYQKNNSDYDEIYQEYLGKARNCMKSQFLRNFYRYSLSTSYGILKQYIQKKPRGTE